MAATPDTTPAEAGERRTGPTRVCRPVSAPAGSPEKLAELIERESLGQSLWHARDGSEKKSAKRGASTLVDVPDFPRILRSARVKACLSVAQLAAKTGLSRTHLYFLEAGEREPTVSTLFRIAFALSVKPSRLLGEREPEPDPSLVYQVCRTRKPPRRLPATLEFFPPDHDAPFGLRGWCRECERKRKRKAPAG
jgi:transcriptional regulator with XRE-family HTH domain